MNVPPQQSIITVQRFIVLVGIFTSVVVGNEEAIDWEHGDEKKISDKLATVVIDAIVSAKDGKAVCATILNGDYTYYNGGDLSVKVTLEKAKLMDIKDFRLKSFLNRGEGKIRNVLDIGGCVLKAKYKLAGKFYGEEGKQIEQTVTKNLQALHLEFTENYSIQDGKVKITGFKGDAYSVQVVDSKWNIEPDKGFNEYVNNVGEGYPHSTGIDHLNAVVTGNIGDGKVIDIKSAIFDIKGEEDEC